MQQAELFRRQVDEALQQLQYEKRQPEELYQPIAFTLAGGGKRIRPVLLMIGCDLFGGNTAKALNPALGIEVFHNFTLLHDDIMDNAPLRRSRPTVHSKWNRNIAILSGDVMFVEACSLMAHVDPAILSRVLKAFNHAAVLVCEGQQLDMNFETQKGVSIEQYTDMIRCKTGALLGGALQIGSIIGGADEHAAQNMYEFGINLGIAFQLQDDLLDVYGQTDKFGKQQGGDIISNKKTFLLLKALELASFSQGKELGKWLGLSDFDPVEKVNAVVSIFDVIGVRKHTEKEIGDYYEKALNSLQLVSAIESKKKELAAYAGALMAREY